MTPDEMEAGRELDALVAEKVMGWHLVTDYDYTPPEDQWHNAAGFAAVAAGNKLIDGKTLRGWSPSTDIAAAWDLFVKLAAPPHRFYLSYDAEDGELPASWDVFEGSDWFLVASADTAPLAICRAALKALSSQETTP